MRPAFAGQVTLQLNRLLHCLHNPQRPELLTSRRAYTQNRCAQQQLIQDIHRILKDYLRLWVFLFGWFLLQLLYQTDYLALLLE